MTRYRKLREAIVNLAAPADTQVAYLDRLFRSCTGGGNAAAYRNAELALELEDIAIATGHMMDFGEITAAEVAAVKPLHDRLIACLQTQDPVFLARAALFKDARWQDIRDLASQALAQLPDESRESDWTRGSASRRPDGE